MLYRFNTSYFQSITAFAVAAALLAGCSHQNTGSKKATLAPPPTDVQQAIQNTQPPPLNLPANMSPEEKQKILAQQQNQWQSQKVAAQRMFAAAAAQQHGPGTKP
ncbi:MAG TPA: hypothetical protein VFW40_14210 [Capsulimonadaceae bacterium]|nr:hypothetical protein [Capsulimonadaceae bacterium]